MLIRCEVYAGEDHLEEWITPSILTHWVDQTEHELAFGFAPEFSSGSKGDVTQCVYLIGGVNLRIGI